MYCGGAQKTDWRRMSSLLMVKITFSENSSLRIPFRSLVVFWEVLNGVGVDGVGGIFPFFFFSFVFASFLFFIVFLSLFSHLAGSVPSGTRCSSTSCTPEWGIAHCGADGAHTSEVKHANTKQADFFKEPGLKFVCF